MRIPAFLLSSLALFGQTPMPASPVIWDRGSVILDLDLHGSSEGQAIRVEGPGLQIVQKIPCPKGTIYRDYLDGIHYVNTSERTEQGRVVTVHKYDGSAWKSIASFTSPYATLPPRIVPLENGRFLAVAERALFKQGKGYWPFAILSARKGKLEVASIPDDLLDTPAWGDPVDADGGGKNLLTTAFFPFSMGLTILRTENALTFVSQPIGHVFTFRAKDGAWLRTTRVFETLKGRTLMDPQLAPVGLGAQPRPDGRILLATRTEDAVLFSLQHRGVRVDEGAMKDPARMKQALEAVAKAEEEGLKAHPRILWWAFDPDTGKLEPEMPPMNFPDRFSTMAQLMQFQWRIKADGNLIHTGLPQAVTAPQGKLRKLLGVVGIK